MTTNKKSLKIVGAALLGLLSQGQVHAYDPPAPGIVGKNDWLFYRYELSDANDAPGVNASIDLMQRFNRMLAKQGVALAVAMVPIKMRVYSDNLPSDIKLNDYLVTNYDRITKSLRTAGIQSVDLNTPFMGSPQRTGDNPLYFRMDTHWAPAGVMLAAETIRKEIDANPALKKAIAPIPEEKYTMQWDAKKPNSRARDLVPQLPKGSSVNPAPEQIQQFLIGKPKNSASLLSQDLPDIALVGSSYSASWTKFADALRFTLQRDLVPISITADQGMWVGMETFLRNEAFQSKRPKLIIWELPERDMKAGPDNKFREARYQMNGQEWLVRTATLIEASCAPGAAKIRTESSMPALEAKQTGGSDYVDITLDQPSHRLDYLAAKLTLVGAKEINAEASGPGVAPRRFTIPLSGDEEAQVFKVSLFNAGSASGYTKLRLTTGKSDGFSLKDIKLCRLTDDPLQ